ncbi:MAG: ABC transporter permease [Tepidanaerobacteraceae bacterium]|nr:ABC transporter permease [Tepidanaerobacteraceae bacterium]
MRQETIRRLFSLALLFTLIIIFGTTSKYFLTPNNIFTLLREAAVTGILAVGVTFVIITAGIDLSTGALVALIAMICARLLYSTTLSVPVILLIGAIIGILAGSLNGFLVAKLKLPDFIATLSTQGIFRGLTLVFAIREHGVISNKVIQNPAFIILGGHINGLYLATIAFIIIAVIGQFILRETRFGIYTYAVGANLKSANLSGINSDRVKIMVYTISGLCCAIGAFFLAAKMQSATPEMGIGLEFDVIAAVVVGGCSFSGGRGDVFGSVIGTLFMAVLTNGLYKYNFPAAYQIIIKGLVIVVMVIFDSMYQKFMEARTTKAKKLEDMYAQGNGPETGVAQ